MKHAVIAVRLRLLEGMSRSCGGSFLYMNEAPALEQCFKAGTQAFECGTKLFHFGAQLRQFFGSVSSVTHIGFPGRIREVRLF